MKYYQHELTNVQDYLHHRPPYLLVEKIVSVSPTEVITEKVVSEDDYFMKGHFPGSPIFPGAMMQELSTQSAGILIAAHYNPMPAFNTADPFFNEYALGVLVKVKQARYKSFARAGDKLTVKVELKEQVSEVFDFAARIFVADQMIMRSSFQLMNIKSKVLQGV